MIGWKKKNISQILLLADAKKKNDEGEGWSEGFGNESQEEMAVVTMP